MESSQNPKSENNYKSLTGFTFVEIKKTKTRMVLVVFSFLIFFYFLTVCILAGVLKAIFILDNSIEWVPKQNLSLGLTSYEILFLLILAFILALVHWFISTRNLVNKILKNIGAKELDPKDNFHRRLKNITEEISVASGGKNIEIYSIPTSGKNAFSISDFSGRSAVGVTEGLLARLTRPQLEAVVAHEVAHIVSGDSLIASVTSSIFGLYASVIANLEKGLGKRGTNLYFWAAYIILSVFKGMNFLLMMFISREKEYRADAVAVELSRDPLSLAESLYIISNSWRGNGFGADYLESIFFMNPSFKELDEKEGIFPELFSTHPPASKRIRLLIEQAHTNLKSVVESAMSKQEPNRRFFEDMSEPIKKNSWFVAGHGGKWNGPYGIEEIASVSILTPQAWVQKIGEDKVELAYEDAELNAIFRKEYKNSDTYDCPACKTPLSEINYEDTSIYQCKFCRGVLVPLANISKILSRCEEGFKSEVLKMAAAIKSLQESSDISKLQPKIKPGALCPKCKKRMERAFYSLYYLIEIDRCHSCNMIWFERFKLEVLQKLYEDNEKKITEVR